MKTIDREISLMKGRIKAVLDGEYKPLHKHEERALVGVVYLLKGSEGYYIGKTSGTFSDRYDSKAMRGPLYDKIGSLEEAYIISFPDEFNYIKSLEDFAYDYCIMCGVKLRNTQEISRPTNRVRTTREERRRAVSLQYLDGEIVEFDSIKEACAVTGMGKRPMAKAANGEPAWSANGWHTAGIKYMKCRRPKSFIE